MPKKKLQVVKEIGLEVIDEPRGRIRLDIDSEKVKELADNIAQIGLLQPIVVREVDGRFEVIAGHRRLLAFRQLGKAKIPCIVRVVNDTECALARASENLRRVDLSPIEEAATYADLRDNHGLSVDEIAKEMGPSAGVVKRRLDLLKMPPNLQQAIHSGKISYGVAEELWRITDEGQRDYYLGYAVDHGITVAVARSWVDDWKRSLRAPKTDVGGTPSPSYPLETKPIYLTCEICHGPTPIEETKNVTMCAGCLTQIQNALKGQQ